MHNKITEYFKKFHGVEVSTVIDDQDSEILVSVSYRGETLNMALVVVDGDDVKVLRSTWDDIPPHRRASLVGGI